MRLLNEWRLLLRKAWSIRLMLLAGVLSAFEVAFSMGFNPLSLPPGLFAGFAALTTGAAFIARLVAQKGVSDGNENSDR